MPGNVADLTPTQISMWVHASYVHSERMEERLKREKLCEYCGAEEVFDGRCRAEGCGRPQTRFAKMKSGPNGGDVIQWPPGRGQVYVGDAHQSAAEKFKEACLSRGDLSPYHQYCRTLGATTFKPTGEIWRGPS